ncbi:MAG: hypothetical protein R6X18_04450, partial [Chloroflexota bacterium]
YHNAEAFLGRALAPVRDQVYIATKLSGTGGQPDLSAGAVRSLEVDYQVFIHILDSDGNLVAQSDKLNPGEFPTRRWPTERYVPDYHRLLLSSHTPPGLYTVAIGLWVQADGWRLPLFNDSGEQIGDYEPLFTVEVK